MAQDIAVANRKLKYLPAINLAKNRFLRQVQGNDGEVYSANWWSKNSFFNYDSVLVSAFYGMKTPDLRYEFSMPKSLFVMLDSGGYQNVMVEGADISPQKLIQWQQDNGDAGLILDHPPYEANGVQFGGNINHNFKTGMEKTAENAKIALSLKNNENFHLYGVVQGETFKQMLEWMYRMDEVETDLNKPFDAWALSPKPSTDVLKIALYGVLAIKEFSTPIHLLQISGFDTILVSAYIASKYNNTVSIDSSTFALGERYGRFMDPYEFGTFLDFGHNEEKREAMGLGDRKKLHFKRMPCLCPVCSKTNLSTTELNNSDYTLLNLHNLYQIVQFTNYAEVIAEDREYLNNFISRYSPQKEKTLLALEMIDFGLDHDLEQVWDRYKHKIEHSQDGMKQKSLSSW